MKISEVSNNIKGLRFRKKLSQQQLADLVGCTRQTIISLEQNRYSPSFVLVAKIAYVFEVSVSDTINIDFEKPLD